MLLLDLVTVFSSKKEARALGNEWNRWINLAHVSSFLNCKELVEYSINMHENASFMCTHCLTWQFANVGTLCHQHCPQEKGFSCLDLGSQFFKYSTLQQGLTG